MSNCGESCIDVGAGKSQFMIREIRRRFQLNKSFKLKKFITEEAFFCEIQLDSCYDIIRIYGTDINLWIGDAKKLHLLPSIARGFWVYIESSNWWVPLTLTIKDLIFQGNVEKRVISSKEDFVVKLQQIIGNLNETFIIMKDNPLYTPTETPSLRRDNLLSTTHSLNEMFESESDEKDSRITVPTPPEVVERLLTPIDVSEKDQIIFIFTAELCEAAIHEKNLDPDNLTLLVDEANLPRAESMYKMYGVKYLVSKDKTGANIRELLGTRKYKYGISNPPFSEAVEILCELMSHQVCEQYVFVYPSTHLINISKSNKLKDMYRGHLVSATFFNGNSAFDLKAGHGIAVPCVYVHVDTTSVHDTTSVDFFGDKFTVSNLDDITKFGKEWLPIVKPFYTKIKSLCQKDNVTKHKVYKETPGKKYVQWSRQHGHIADNDAIKMVKDDFYTMCSKDPNENKGVRLSFQGKNGKPKPKGNCSPTFPFNSETEADNFLNYSCTMFARFCLALGKNSLNMDDSAIRLIPWFDFTQSWDDAKLFTYHGIDQLTQDYIRSFLG